MPPRKPAAEDEIKVIKLRRIGEAIVEVPIEGTTPVIPHKWSEKALKLMREKQMAEAGSLSARREPKNPDEEAEQSCYWLDLPDGRHAAVPAVSFKAATVGGCRFYSGITMVQARLMFFVEGQGDEQLVPLDGKWAMREDTPRISGGGPDLRDRMAVWPWSAVLRIRYVPSLIGPDSVFALVDAAGRLGVGDWRPASPKSNTGTYGQFRVSASSNATGTPVPALELAGAVKS